LNGLEVSTRSMVSDALCCGLPVSGNADCKIVSSADIAIAMF
jgi:hypothetical protein